MDLSNVTDIKIPEGNVVRITCGENLIWQKPQYFTIKFASNSGSVTFNNNTCEYSTDLSNWSIVSGRSTININARKVYLRATAGNAHVMATGDAFAGTVSTPAISVTSKYSVEGNILSLLYGSDFASKTTLPSGSDSNFAYMFINETNLTSAEYLLLPSDTTESCYQYMFYGCTGLTTAPELPATTLAHSCYFRMFWKCTSLTMAPKLPATTLASYCCYGMFYGCTSLTTAPELPATTLTKYCYCGMFRDCTSLTMAPKLPATTLASECYQDMFQGCTSLTTAPELPATTLAGYCYSNMFYGCTSLTTAPELPATTLPYMCYISMFNHCTSLTSLKADFTTIPKFNRALDDWLAYITTTGIFYKPADATYDDSAPALGLPSTWTVQTFTD